MSPRKSPGRARASAPAGLDALFLAAPEGERSAAVDVRLTL